MPVPEPYHCHKHQRDCRPVGDAPQFLRRYAADTVQRLAEFAGLRRDVTVDVLHADARDGRPARRGSTGSSPHPPTRA